MWVLITIGSIIALIVLMVLVAQIKIKCDLCKKRFPWSIDKQEKQELIPELKGSSSFGYRYGHLCPACWSKLKMRSCVLCDDDFDVEKNEGALLFYNLKENGVELGQLKPSSFACPLCVRKSFRDRCEICRKAFYRKDNKAGDLNENDVLRLIKSERSDRDKMVPANAKWVKEFERVCERCFEEACSELDALGYVLRGGGWIGGTKSNSIDGYHLAKTIGSISYDGKSCGRPEDVSAILKRDAVLAGGNAFVNSRIEGHVEAIPETYLAGYSKNGNPYYKERYRNNRWYTGSATAVLLATEKADREGRGEKGRSKKGEATGSRPQRIVIDGLNVCYWGDSETPDLSIVLDVASYLVEHGITFICYFDANTRYVIEEHQRVFYRNLLRGEHSDRFVEVPGGATADEFILDEASRTGSAVLSNDRYRDFRSRFPWLKDESRLFKGLVVGDRIQIPGLGINVDRVAGG